jgi:hypothetical protein
LPERTNYFFLFLLGHLKIYMKLEVVVYICNHSYLGGGGRGIQVRGQPRQKQETLSEKLKAKGPDAWLNW